jgi:hypothetical protein
MSWSIVFFNERVEAGIANMTAGFVARFIRYTERMESVGPDLGLPHTKAMGEGLFELRLKGTKGLRVYFFAPWWGGGL